MASILVIGVGSTGLSAMEQAQQFYYEFTKKNSPGRHNSAFLFLETDGTRKPKVTPNGSTDIVSCYLCPENITATLTEWNGRYAWMPNTAEVLNTHSGAAGQPAYGRIALWEKEVTVRNNISHLYRQIGGNASTNIYLVGSLTGGTGTGIFLDLAYMIRQITDNNNIYGMFMLPNNGDVGNRTKDVMYENAYSSLKTLDKFSKADVKTNENYRCVLPGGTDISNQSAPFCNVQFFTQDFSDATASMTSLKQLVQSVGLNLALRMLDLTHQVAPFQNLINARLVDYTAPIPNGIFSSMGLNMFQYPEGLLEEYFTTKQLDNTMLACWADTENYIDANGTPHAITTLETRIRLEATQFVHETIAKAIEKCQGGPMLGKSTFNAALENEIEMIITDNYQAASLEHYIYSLFDAQSKAPKFYAAISGQATNLRDELIISIAKKIEEESTKYQNITVVKLWIDSIVVALHDLEEDWQKRYTIDGAPDVWNNCWKEHLSDRLTQGKWFYSMLFTYKEWYKEVISGAAKLCYFNAYIPMIEQVYNAILNRNGVEELMSASGIKVPTIKDLNEITTRVIYLRDSEKEDSVVGRKNSIHGQLSQNDNPQIIYLYKHGSCDADVNAAEGKYDALPRHLSYSDISGDSLWHFLLNPEGCAKIRAIMIAKGLSYIQQLELFAHTDVVQIMQNLQPTHYAYNKVHHLLTSVEGVIRQDVPAMVRLTRTLQFREHQCLRLIVASPLPQNMGVAKIMVDTYPVNDAESNYVQLPSMKNTVLVYQEYAYLGNDGNGGHKTFNPLIHLAYQEQVLNAIVRKVESGNFDESVRLAYIDKQTLIDINHVNIK